MSPVAHLDSLTVRLVVRGPTAMMMVVMVFDGKEVRPVQAIYSSKDRQVLFSSLSLYLERIERYAAHAHEGGGASVFGVACSTTT